MTYLHIHNQGLPKRAVAERRCDRVTADKVQDALRAHGLRAAAQAMEHQQVDLAVALRVLSHPGRRRVQMPVASIPGPLHDTRSRTDDFADFVAVPA